jgi:hypothetical protein
VETSFVEHYRHTAARLKRRDIPRKGRWWPHLKMDWKNGNGIVFGNGFGRRRAVGGEWKLPNDVEDGKLERSPEMERHDSGFAELENWEVELMKAEAKLRGLIAGEGLICEKSIAVAPAVASDIDVELQLGGEVFGTIQARYDLGWNG